MIWFPIKQLPESYKDGRQLLLRYGKECELEQQTIINGWFVSNPDSPDWWNTTVGFIGTPTHFCVIALDGFTNLVDNDLER